MIRFYTMSPGRLSSRVRGHRAFFLLGIFFLVLASLRRSPYEPIRQCSLKHLFEKTAFLVSLAAGRRCSEIHALSEQSVAEEHDGPISLRFIPVFLAKNQPSSTRSPPLSSGRCALPWVGTTRTGSYAWLGRCAFTVSVELPATARSSRPHEIRAWAASLAWAHNSSMSDICDAAYWFNQGTFIDFYLRVISRINGDNSRGIASVVVAQQPISSTRPGGHSASRK